MDITFSKDAKPLDDDKCTNGTGVGGTPIGASQAEEAAPSGSAQPGAASSVKPLVGGGLLAMVLAVALV
jgi:hypothetical protein